MCCASYEAGMSAASHVRGSRRSPWCGGCARCDDDATAEAPGVDGIGARAEQRQRRRREHDGDGARARSTACRRGRRRRAAGPPVRLRWASRRPTGTAVPRRARRSRAVWIHWRANRTPAATATADAQQQQRHAGASAVGNIEKRRCTDASVAGGVAGAVTTSGDNTLPLSREPGRDEMTDSNRLRTTMRRILLLCVLALAAPHRVAAQASVALDRPLPPGLGSA